MFNRSYNWFAKQGDIGMSADNQLREVTAQKLDRFSVEQSDEEPREMITAIVSGLWWVDGNTGQEGQFNVHVEYRPRHWVLYPDTLTDFLRSFHDVSVRPEPAATFIWNELATLLYDSESDAEGNLRIRVDAETVADEYEIEKGEINE